jgi:hypothetical protein
LKPISATGQSQSKLLPVEKTPPNEKTKNLKTCLLKKYMTRNSNLKNATAKKEDETL